MGKKRIPRTADDMDALAKLLARTLAAAGIALVDRPAGANAAAARARTGTIDSPRTDDSAAPAERE